MGAIKNSVQGLARKFGYEIVRIQAVSQVPLAESQSLLNPALAICEAKGVEVIEPMSLEVYQKLCPPILGEPREVPADYPVTAHKDLSEAVDNTSMRNYVRAQHRDGKIYLTDIYPESHYYSRQRMLMTVYKQLVGDRLDGNSVLDIGCSSGYYCFYASALGASSVLGFDARPEHEEQFGLLHTLLNMPASCAYRHIDMEREFETLKESFDIVLAMGTLYHVYDHVRYLQNLYRICKGIAIVESECSGSADNSCLAHLEDVSNLRSAIHGPVIYPSVSWVIDLMRWVGFRNIKYVDVPSGVEDRWGFRKLRRVMLVAEK